MMVDYGAVELERLASLSLRFQPIAAFVAERVNALCGSESCHPIIVCGRRSGKEQAKVWAKGRQLKQGADPARRGAWKIVDRRLIVTNAMPGESAHETGDAMDIALIDDTTSAWLVGGRKPDPRWKSIVGEAAHAHGCRWGGLFQRFDGAHVQSVDWRKDP